MRFGTPQRSVSVGKVELSNDRPLAIIGGVNVLESRELAIAMCDIFREMTRDLGMPYIFKGSFDKANRSSGHSYRGPGLEEGLKILAEVKWRYNVPIITDVHEASQVAPVAEVADVLQLPAFLSRQTDLVRALAQSQKPVNIKKAQFLAPEDMVNIVQKFQEYGNDQLLLCERGTCFGYHNLVVDMLGFQVMRKLGFPLVFDVTHSLQLPGGRGDAAAGRGEMTIPLARSGVAQCIAALFVESHPNPTEALCDGPSALVEYRIRELLLQVHAIDQAVKRLKPDDVD